MPSEFRTVIFQETMIGCSGLLDCLMHMSGPMPFEATPDAECIQASTVKKGSRTSFRYGL